MPARDVAQRVWNGTTTTGSGTAHFGTGQQYLTAYISNPSTKQFVNKVEVSVGGSTAWIEVLAASSSTGSAVSRTSTGGIIFDKARVVVTTNATTGVADAWLIASE